MDSPTHTLEEFERDLSERKLSQTPFTDDPKLELYRKDFRMQCLHWAELTQRLIPGLALDYGIYEVVNDPTQKGRASMYWLDEDLYHYIFKNRKDEVMSLIGWGSYLRGAPDLYNAILRRHYPRTRSFVRLLTIAIKRMLLSYLDDPEKREELEAKFGEFLNSIPPLLNPYSPQWPHQAKLTQDRFRDLILWISKEVDWNIQSPLHHRIIYSHQHEQYHYIAEGTPKIVGMPARKHKDIVDDILEEYRAYDPHDLLTNSETMHRWEEPPYFDYSL